LRVELRVELRAVQGSGSHRSWASLRVQVYSKSYEQRYGQADVWMYRLYRVFKRESRREDRPRAERSAGGDRRPSLRGASIQVFQQGVG